MNALLRLRRHGKVTADDTTSRLADVVLHTGQPLLKFWRKKLASDRSSFAGLLAKQLRLTLIDLSAFLDTEMARHVKEAFGGEGQYRCRAAAPRPHDRGGDRQSARRRGKDSLHRVRHQPARV